MKHSIQDARYMVAILCVVTLVGALVIAKLDNNTPDIAFGNRYLSIEEVSSPEALEKGLSGRSVISDREGMLFVFSQSDEYCFWMKDMKFPIDILWLDESKRVLYTQQNVSPDTYPQEFCPDQSAKYVLEVQAGLSGKAGVGVGTQL